MRFLIMTDIEGVTGITSYQQAENSQLGRDMLMHDLLAVIEGIRSTGDHEIVVYDMHTDGRNVDIEQVDCPVIMGKPILPDLWRGVGGKGIDGFFMVGLHTMQNAGGCLLQHSYLREYDSIHLNGILVGEIGIEAALAGEAGVPLKLVTGDDMGCKEAEDLIDGIVTCAVKESLSENSAICYTPDVTAKLLKDAAKKAVLEEVKPFIVKGPYEIKIKYSQCRYLDVMKQLHPEIFENEDTVVMHGDNLLKTWSEYLNYEREMIASCQ